MNFDPNSPFVQLCLQGMAAEGEGHPEEAARRFLEAWNGASSDGERFMAAHFVARVQTNASDRLQWLQTALRHALLVDDDGVAAAIPALYSSIAECHEALSDHTNAKTNHALANSSRHAPSDRGPFYHGTKADLRTGDLLTAGFESNYQRDVLMNHIYFTASIHGAGLAAALAKGDDRERVYVVEPSDDFEDDPNVTNKKFPGNPTRSYRTRAPLKIVGEVTDWARQTPEELKKWREKLARGTGEIIN